MITRTLLTEILEEIEVQDEQVRCDYSGRGMYGKTCFALVGGYATLTTFVAEVARRQGLFDATGDDSVNPDLFDALDAIVNGLAVDQLGHDLIFYWPRLVVVDQ